jgi:SAM-dependent methyltransferase
LPPATEARGFRVEHWLDPGQIAGLEYAGYWNDEDVERGKEWFVLDGDFAPMERYLGDVGLVEDLRACLREAEELRGRPIAGVGLDLAAGTLWAARHLLAAGPVERLYCVEYSQHRLLKIGPAVLEHYGTTPDRVVLALGSFYDVRLPDASVDFVFMSQALHHADEPERLLAELARVLRPDGVVIVMGEHVVTARMQAMQAIRLGGSRLPASAQRRVFGREIEVGASGLAPEPDRVAGDHFYTRRQYRHMFGRHGFRQRFVRRHGAAFQCFVLWQASGE